MPSPIVLKMEITAPSVCAWPKWSWVTTAGIAGVADNIKRGSSNSSTNLLALGSRRWPFLRLNRFVSFTRNLPLVIGDTSFVRLALFN